MELKQWYNPSSIETRNDTSCTKRELCDIKKEVENWQFWYKKPKRDKNEMLLARSDLKKPEQVANGYSSIKELFTKLNSMTPTQVEPWIKPFYYWEIDKETGEKIPTFIIVWDIHIEQTNTNKEVIQEVLWKEFLMEENEDFTAETEVVWLLKNKFGITTIWIEGENYSSNHSTTLIGEELNRLSIKYIWMEEESLNETIGQKEIIWFKKSLQIFKLLWIDLDTNVAISEIPTLLEKPHIMRIMEDISKKQEPNFTYEEIEKEVDQMRKLPKEELLDIYKLIKIMLQEYGLDQLIEEVKNDPTELTIKSLIENTITLQREIDFITIKERNTIWINLMTNNFKDDKIAIMVWWKDHSRDMIEQIKQKYNGKVNIYVAK